MLGVADLVVESELLDLLQMKVFCLVSGGVPFMTFHAQDECESMIETTQPALFAQEGVMQFIRQNMDILGVPKSVDVILTDEVVAALREHAEGTDSFVVLSEDGFELPYGQIMSSWRPAGHSGTFVGCVSDGFVKVLKAYAAQEIVLGQACAILADLAESNLTAGLGDFYMKLRNLSLEDKRVFADALAAGSRMMPISDEIAEA